MPLYASSQPALYASKASAYALFRSKSAALVNIAKPFCELNIKSINVYFNIRYRVSHRFKFVCKDESTRKASPNLNK